MPPDYPQNSTTTGTSKHARTVIDHHYSNTPFQSGTILSSLIFGMLHLLNASITLWDLDINDLICRGHFYDLITLISIILIPNSGSSPDILDTYKTIAFLHLCRM